MSARPGAWGDAPLAIVLAGGASRRFGRDKAAALVDGVPSLERVVAAARAVAGRVLVVGGAAAPVGAERVADLAPGEGPLQGTVAGWRAAPRGDRWLLACDLPWLTPEHLSWLARPLPAGVAARVTAAADGGAGPVPGFYAEAAGAAFEAAWARGRRSLRAALLPLAVDVVGEAALRAAGLDPRGFQDFDTPEALARLSPG